MFADLGLLAILWIAAVSFGAGLVRGYSGFGFAAIVLSGAGLVANPVVFVPVVLVSDVFLTAGQARGIRREIEWRRILWMALGAVITLPFSVWAITSVGVDMARLIISLAILLATLALWTGWRMTRPMGPGAHVVAGIVSGTAHGASLGGLPIAVFFAAQSIPATAFRATIIVFFFLLNFWALPLMFRAGMVSTATFALTALCLPFMALGVWYGSHRFRASSPEGFRQFALLLLGCLALAGIVRAIA